MQQIFSIWPTMADMARDLGQKYTTVISWRDRGSIPARHDAAIIRAARRRGARVTPADLFKARAASETQQ